MRKMHQWPAIGPVAAATLSGAARAPSTGAAARGWCGRAPLAGATVDERRRGIKDCANAGGVAAGYRFDAHWSREAGLVKLGGMRSQATVRAGPTTLHLEASGFTLGGAGKLPLSNNGTGRLAGGRTGVAWLEDVGRAPGSDRSSVVDRKNERKARTHADASVSDDVRRDFGVSLNVDCYRIGDRRAADATLVSPGPECRL